VALETPLHLQRRGLPYERHLIDLAVAARATNTFIHVNAVIEIHKVRETMHPGPFDGFPGAVTLANRLQIGTVGKQYRMAIHAGFRWRNAGNGRSFNGGMAIAAVNPVIAHMMFVAKLNGLLLGHILIGGIRGARDGRSYGEGQRRQKNGGKQTHAGDGVRAAVENLSHREFALRE